MPVGARSGRGTGGFLAAVLATAGVAAVAVALLSPEAPEPVAVDPAAYFETEQLERAEDYRSGQRTLYLIGLAVELWVLGVLAAGRPRPMRRLLERAGARPLLGAAAAGAGLAVLLAALALPTDLIAQGRAVDVGLSTQGEAEWLLDRAKAAGIALTLAALGAVVLVGLQRRLPRLWWLAASAAVVGYAVVTSWLAPVVLAPLFNDFEPLEQGAVRDRVLELADRAEVGVGEVYVVDASRRGTSINAYVGGLGSSKRVVLYDNLLERTERAELEAVVAHELGHVAANDIPRGLLYVALVAPLGMLAVARGGSLLAGRWGAAPGTPAALPAYAFTLALAAFAVGIAGNVLSRAVEARADAFSLRLTDDPEGMIDLQIRLATVNLADPSADGPLDALLRTHPATLMRIGAALAYERDRPSGAADGAS